MNEPETNICEKIEDTINRIVQLKNSLADVSLLCKAIQQKIGYLSQKGTPRFAENCIDQLIHYAISMRMTEDGYPQGYTDYIRTIICLFEIFPIFDRINFTKTTVNCITCSINHKANENIVIPSTDITKKKVIVIDEDIDSSILIKLYFSILEGIILISPRMYDTFITDMFELSCNMATSSLTIRALSFYIPLGHAQVIKLIRLIFNFILNTFKQTEDLQANDEYTARILHRCMSLIPVSIRSLVGRDFISYIRSFEFLKDDAPKFLEEFFNALMFFVNGDHACHTLIIDTMERTFSSYHSIESYRKIWKVLLQYNKQYSTCLKKIQNDGKCDPELIPSLVDIDASFTPLFANISNFRPDLFFEIAAKQTKLQPLQRAHVRRFLSNTPPLRLIKSLFNVAPDDVLDALPNYPPEYAIAVFSENPKLLAEKIDMAMNICVSGEYGISISLLSLIVSTKHELGQEIDADVVCELKVAMDKIENYSDPIFVKAITSIFNEDVVKMKLDRNFVKQILDQNFDACSVLMNNDKLSYHIMRCLLQIIAVDENELAGKAFRVIHRSQVRSTLNKLYPYEIGGLLFEIYYANNKRFFEVSQFFYEDKVKRKNTFYLLKKYIFPYVISTGDNDKIKAFLKESVDDLATLFQTCFPRIAEYALVCVPKEETTKVIQHIKKVSKKSFLGEIKEQKPSVSKRIQFATCHPVEYKAKRAINVISILIAPPKRDKDHDQIIQEYWLRYFSITLIYVTRLLKKDEILIKKASIHFITYSLQYIMDYIKVYMSDILTALSLANDQNLEYECVMFWKDFFSRDIPGDIIRQIFIPVAHQLLTLFSRYEQDVADILHILIVDYKELTHDLFKEIAYYTPFKSSCLLIVKNEMKDYIDEFNWSQQVMHLVKQLYKARAKFRKLILEEVFQILKDHESDLYQNSIDIKTLTNHIWSVAAHECDNDNLILFGRIMAILPFSSESKKKDEDMIDKSNVDEIMRYIITKYLVKTIKENPNSKIVIQEFLMYLGCRTVDQGGEIVELDERGEHNWSLFPDEIKPIIEIYRSSSFKSTQEKKVAKESLNFGQRNFSVSKWIKTIFQKLIVSVPSRNETDFEKKKKDGGYLEKCYVGVFFSAALGIFALSYLISYNTDNEAFCEILRTEWNVVFQLLDNSDRRKQNNARAVIQCFFSLFETLNKMNISESDHETLINWKYLKITNEFDLAKAALRCQLWPCALHHLDNVFRYKKSDTAPEIINEIYVMMRDAFKSAGDIDSYQYLKDKLSNGNEFKDELTASEMTMMDANETRSKKIDLINEMVGMGRFERALNDSKNLRTTFQGDLRLDSSITMSALALGRWDECDSIFNEVDSKLSFEFDESRSCIEAPRMRFDISIGKYISNLQYSDVSKSAEKIQEQRKKLVPELQDAFLGAYDMLCPVLVKIRLLDEVELFTQAFAKDSKEYSFDSMKRWINQEPVNIEQLSRTSCFRCGMIHLLFKDDVNKKNHELAQEWISLSRACRKDEYILAAEMYSTRARKLTKDENDVNCIMELAKVAWARNPSDGAIKLLDSAAKTPEVMAKVSFLRAKFLDELNSLDADGISKLYSQATESLETAGKAHYQLATLTDHRIENYITYVEAEGQEVSVSGKLSRMGSQKFWGSTSSSMNIAQFIKYQIPFALKNYFLAVIKMPQYSTEVVPRILSLFFDICRILYMEEPPKPYSLISVNQKPTIITRIQDTMKEFVPLVDSSVWFNSITQLISRVEQSEELAPYLFNLITTAVSRYPESALWHLMYVQHSQVELRRFKFERIWDMIMEKNKDRAEKFEELKRKFTAITTDLITMTTQLYQTKSPIDVTAAEICPMLVKDIENSGISIPITKAFKAATAESAPKLSMMADNIHIFYSQQMPKQITLVSEGDDQIRFLCKKDDDLRKDMRMMEFASFVNTILDRDHKCKHRMISMTTFSVVCLDERCAILEWVEHTKCFRHIVTELYKAHNCIMTSQEINELIGNEIKIAPKKRKDNFTNIILKKFPPISNLWFADQFKESSRWFNAISTYTRSTAVWSMVGYIVGLGDRHTENILFNYETGAAVHVDFCCMFDKAKTLAVPECVPFRLTQNIVAGMGALGVDAAFSTSCCLIMSALREKAAKIVTMLQTFVQDPLLEWKKMTKDCEEIAAKQTLKEVERRLLGFSEDRSKIHSTEYFVKDLISKATSSDNLAKMWYGWQPYF